MNKKEISVFAAFIITFTVSMLSGQIYEAGQIKDNTLRLHIIANSNTAQDQQDKLFIRDEILKMDDIIPADTKSFENALDSVSDNIGVVEKRVNNLLKQKNIPYTARCSVEKFYFDTTQYTDFALPKGEYTALTVRLGQAEGKNWWCVMYPSLCTQSFGQVTDENVSEFVKTDKITPRFKIVEIYENIKNSIVKHETRQYKNLQ